MKLSELLLEKMTAGVYVNKEGTLSVISNLIQDEFGFENKWGGGGICLLMQAVYTIQSVLNCKSEDIVKAMKRLPAIRNAGFTFEQVFKALNGIVVDNKKIKLSFNEISNVDEAVREVKSGQPVVCAFNNRSPVFREMSRGGSHDGIADSVYAKRETKEFFKRFNNDASAFYHALLLIGHDSQDDMLIFRDSRSSYAYKGYVKLPIDVVKEHPNLIAKMLTINVDSAKELK